MKNENERMRIKCFHYYERVQVLAYRCIFVCSSGYRLFGIDSVSLLGSTSWNCATESYGTQDHFWGVSMAPYFSVNP